MKVNHSSNFKVNDQANVITSVSAMMLSGELIKKLLDNYEQTEITNWFIRSEF